MNELVMRISFPLHRLAASRDDDAGTIFRTVAFHFHGCGEVHQQRHGTDHTLRMVYERYKLA